MNKIESLNKKYLIVLDACEQLKGCVKKMDDELQLSNVSKTDIAFHFSRLFCDVSDRISILYNGFYDDWKDTFKLCEGFSDSYAEISKYSDTTNLSSSKFDSSFSSFYKKILASYDKFEMANIQYEKKYGKRIDSNDSLVYCIYNTVKQTLKTIEKQIKDIKAEAKSIMTQQSTIDLENADTLNTIDQLPTEILIARRSKSKQSIELLKDIGIKGIYENIEVNIKDSGNIIISSNNNSEKRIDEFISFYVLRVLSSFPLGSINIHFFNNNANLLYKRIKNVFDSELLGEKTRKTINIHSSIKELKSFKDVTCEDIFRKTTNDRPDLYSIYHTDKTDQFTLVVIRDGLTDNRGYANAEDLELLNYLIAKDGVGHKCGIRFLIVNPMNSTEKTNVNSCESIINQIIGSCECKIQFENDRFLIAGKEIEVLRTNENPEIYVENRSKRIAEAINSKENSHISFEEISSNTVQTSIANIISIPVGKSGKTIVELPFSCKDTEGTAAGQCIGYMVIGTSGSGKSSFFHSLILNGCKKYAPNDLQFWLLDFKNGGATSKYRNSGLPHISIISENNKSDDALCLFHMILDEMERRIKLFNGSNTDNIADYNRMLTNVEEHLPRIIIAIDEIQEIFINENAPIFKDLISSIVTRMRATGMHFVMVAQNLAEGKSYMLKEAFLPSASGRICFRVAADIPRDSGFDEEFINRKNEISVLNAGEAFLSYGKGTIKKIKIAYVKPEEMANRIFSSIRSLYPNYSDKQPMVIGSKTRLSIASSHQGEETKYCEIIERIVPLKNRYEAIIGEDVYRMVPSTISFSQNNNSSLLILGDDRLIASSLCTSIFFSLIRQNVIIHIINADKSKISDDNYNEYPHPLLAICKKIETDDPLIHSYTPKELVDVVSKLYKEYSDRRDEMQQTEDDDIAFPAEFLIVNDLFAIDSFCNDDLISDRKNNDTQSENDLFGLNMPAMKYELTIQQALSRMLKDGYRYNIHIILAIKGDPYTWRSSSRITSDAGYSVLFNNTEYSEQFPNSFSLKEMLRNIANRNERQETLAVWYSKKALSKMRPIVYDMSNESEVEMFEKLMKGE